MGHDVTTLNTYRIWEREGDRVGNEDVDLRLPHKQGVKRPVRVKQFMFVLRNREIDLECPEEKQGQPNYR